MTKNSYTHLVTLRKDKELSQEQLAYILGTTKNYIRHIEKGLIFKVPVTVIMSYCQFFNLNYNDLLGLFDGIIDKSKWSSKQHEINLIKKGINPATIRKSEGTQYVW